MELVKFDIHRHDVNLVSRLIYETDAETFNFYFNKRQNAVDRIEKLVRIGNNNSYGHENIYVATGEDDQVYGLVLTFMGSQEDIKNDFKVYFSTLSLGDALKFVFLDIVDGIFLSKLDRDDYYLAAVAVAPDCRGKGVGTFILEKSLELARENGSVRVVLDVDIDNKGALKMYKSFGFKIFNKKSMRWVGGVKGDYNMEYKLNYK